MDTKQFRITVLRNFKGVEFTFDKFTARSAPGSKERIFVIVSLNGTWRILIDNVPGEGKSLGMAKNAVKKLNRILAPA